MAIFVWLLLLSHPNQTPPDTLGTNGCQRSFGSWILFDPGWVRICSQSLVYLHKPIFSLWLSVAGLETINQHHDIKACLHRYETSLLPPTGTDHSSLKCTQKKFRGGTCTRQKGKSTDQRASGWTIGVRYYILSRDKLFIWKWWMCRCVCMYSFLWQVWWSVCQNGGKGRPAFSPHTCACMFWCGNRASLGWALLVIS